MLSELVKFSDHYDVWSFLSNNCRQDDNSIAGVSVTVIMLCRKRKLAYMARLTCTIPLKFQWFCLSDKNSKDFQFLLFLVD